MPKRVLTGRVVSDKMDKTGVVAVVSTPAHPKYGKPMKRTKKYKFHDENNEAKAGDLVRVVECRPMSKDKNWQLLEVVERAVVV